MIQSTEKFAAPMGFALMVWCSAAAPIPFYHSRLGYGMRSHPDSFDS